MADEFYNDVKLNAHSFIFPTRRVFIYTVYRLSAHHARVGTQFLFSCRTGGLVAGRIHRARVLPSAGRRFWLQWPWRIARAVHWPLGYKTGCFCPLRSLNYAIRAIPQTSRDRSLSAAALTGGGHNTLHLSKRCDVNNRVITFLCNFLRFIVKKNN